MAFVTIDSVVRSVLLKSGYSLHFYVQYLSYAISGVRFLNINTTGQVNTKRLTVDTNSMSVQIPCDYVDWVRVGYEVDERIKPLILDESLNRLYNSDGNGNIVPYDLTINTGENPTSTDCLETDMDFGLRVDRGDYRFRVLKERDEIQLSADYPYDTVYLEYLSNGTHTDTGSQVDEMAAETLEKYILWQAEVHKRGRNEGVVMAAEKRFNDQWRYLRASQNDLTPEEVVAAVRSGYTPLPRN